MEREKEKTPINVGQNAGQEEEILNPVASARSGDGHKNISQQASEQTSSAISTSQLCCNFESSKKKALDGMYFNLEYYKVLSSCTYVAHIGPV